MTVWFIPLSAIDPTDEDAREHIDRYSQPGTMTTDHAGSSYGQPVIVGEDGTAYGPGDCLDGGWAGAPGAPRDRDLEAAASMAGWRREPNHGETETTY